MSSQEMTGSTRAGRAGQGFPLEWPAKKVGWGATGDIKIAATPVIVKRRSRVDYPGVRSHQQHEALIPRMQTALPDRESQPRNRVNALRAFIALVQYSSALSCILRSSSQDETIPFPAIGHSSFPPHPIPGTEHFRHPRSFVLP